jgi:hypothetical protein
MSSVDYALWRAAGDGNLMVPLVMVFSAELSRDALRENL